jgi:hypothetical protein
MASGKTQDTLRIPDLAKYQKALRDLGATNKELGAASYEAGIITARSVQAFMAPNRRTGKLMSTVKAGKQGTKVVVTIGNNTTAKYAGPINYGWRAEGIKGQYFLQRAIRRTRQRVLDTYLDGLQRLFDKYERDMK